MLGWATANTKTQIIVKISFVSNKVQKKKNEWMNEWMQNKNKNDENLMNANESSRMFQIADFLLIFFFSFNS